jgi:hypothetical protein
MSDPEYVVDRCVCFDMTFERMLAEKCGSVEEAGRRWGCGTKCGLCRPYIQLTMETGETRHPVLDVEEG